MGRNRKDIPPDPTGRFDDDQLLWEKVTQNVKRMNPRPAFQLLKQKKVFKTGSQTKSSADRPQSSQTGEPKARIAPVKAKLADFRLGETSGIDRSSARRMQRGQVLLEDRLDLHGLSQEQAHTRLNAFINQASQQNFRQVLVITGKGRDGHGVLRQKVPSWLKESPLCHYINAISYAQPKDGGKGALYIRLKRLREGTK